jgi:Predicted metal binding domain
MQVDPEVNRLKFETETHRLAQQRATLESRGILMLASTAYPFVDLLFVPRHALRVVAPTTQTGMIVLPQVAMMTVEVPSLAASAFKARFDLSDYDLRAPSLSFLDPSTDTPLRYGTMFRAIEFEEQRKAHIVLLDDHPATHEPFLCLRGIREYHEHPQHSGDEWLLYRRDMSLFSIVMSLWRVSIDLIHPQIVLQPNGIQVQWTAQEKV